MRPLFKAYRLLLSPWFGQTCRFHPSCSHYMEDAIASLGILRGTFLGLGRVLRCHPFHPGGYDPPPAHANPRKA